MAIIFQGTRFSVKSSRKSLVLPPPNAQIRRPLEKTALRFPKTAAPVSAGVRVSDLAFYGKNWLFDGEVRQHSAQVLSTRRLILSNLEKAWNRGVSYRKAAGAIKTPGELADLRAKAARTLEQAQTLLSEGQKTSSPRLMPIWVGN